MAHNKNHSRRISKAVIKALSDEITKGCDRVMAFRNRVAFLTWVGPIIILGSVVIAAKGNLPLRAVNVGYVWIFGLFAAGCYIVLGYIAAQIERQAWTHINQLREILHGLATDDAYEWKSDKYCDNINKDKRLTRAYLAACVCVIFAAACMTIMTFNVGTQMAPPREGKGDAPISRPSGKDEGAAVISRPVGVPS